jgi:hypothetical protein
MKLGGVIDIQQQEAQKIQKQIQEQIESLINTETEKYNNSAYKYLKIDL